MKEGWKTEFMGIVLRTQIKEQDVKCILAPKHVFHPRFDCEVGKATQATWSEEGICGWMRSKLTDTGNENCSGLRWVGVRHLLGVESISCHVYNGGAWLCRFLNYRRHPQYLIPAFSISTVFWLVCFCSFIGQYCTSWFVKTSQFYCPQPVDDGLCGP